MSAKCRGRGIGSATVPERRDRPVNDRAWMRSWPASGASHAPVRSDDPAGLLAAGERRPDRWRRHVRCRVSASTTPPRVRSRAAQRQPGQDGHLPLRPRLRPAPPRPRSGHARVRRAPALPRVVRLAGPAGVQHHRHRRQDHRPRQPGGPRRGRDRPSLRGRLVPGDAGHRCGPADRHPPRHRLRRADGRHDRPADRDRPRLPHRGRRVPRRHLGGGLRPPRPPVPRPDAGRRRRAGGLRAGAEAPPG